MHTLSDPMCKLFLDHSDTKPCDSADIIPHYMDIERFTLYNKLMRHSRLSYTSIEFNRLDLLVGGRDPVMIIDDEYLEQNYKSLKDTGAFRNFLMNLSKGMCVEISDNKTYTRTITLKTGGDMYITTPSKEIYVFILPIIDNAQLHKRKYDDYGFSGFSLVDTSDRYDQFAESKWDKFSNKVLDDFTGKH